jgi:putative oxidoreductase
MRPWPPDDAAVLNLTIPEQPTDKRRATMMTMTQTNVSEPAAPSGILGRALDAYRWGATLLGKASPLANLLLRLYVANVFFTSGLTKIQSWDTTLQLFEYEYHVPVLSPAIAAYAGTFNELAWPVLLAVGLGGRFAAAALFVFNIIAVVSYPDLNAAGLEQHKVWGIILLALTLLGPGRLSIDHLIGRALGHRTA